MRSLLSAVVLSLGLLAHPAVAAELDQLAIQLSGRNGQIPSTSTLTFTAGKPGFFSLTARFNDEVTVSAGGRTFTKQIRDFWNNQAPELETIDKVQLPDGRSRVFIRINSPQKSFDGGFVMIKTPTGLLIDKDPIVVK
jgi:hypothetical protein